MTDKILVGGTFGYVEETTYGVRVRATPIADTVSYAVGELTDPIPFPQEKPSIIRRNAFNSFDPSTMKYGRKVVEFPLKGILSFPSIFKSMKTLKNKPLSPFTAP